jgi:predicted ABC-class ATPase
MYEGSMTIVDPSHPTMEPYVDYSSTYYNESVGFEISTTHKLAQDKPTVVISIPCATLGIDIPDKFTENVEADYCLRAFKKYIDELNAELYNRSRPDNENGKYYLCAPGGEIIKRNTAYFALCPQKDYTNGSGSTVYLLSDGVSRPPLMCLCIRIQVQFPLKKLRKTFQMMCRDLPDAVDRFVLDFDIEGLKKATELAKKQSAIREWLKSSDYCAFVANGSILPRAKGTDLPMLDAIPFRSTPDDEIEVCGVRGMGIKKGVTVITGGGYSGKSTLLDAISAGIYDHAHGDGRELCITDESAVTISAEDGRSVKHVNISPFIQWLPEGDSSDFSTDHASGSTSQAANIMEAIDSGAKLLLIDEDRSAANFMTSDYIMRQLLKKEPIIPYVDRVNELYNSENVSTIAVVGADHRWLAVADNIYVVDDYQICNITQQAMDVCSGNSIAKDANNASDWGQRRRLSSERFVPYPDGYRIEKLEVSNTEYIKIGDEKIDIVGLRDIVSPLQAVALGFMLRRLEITNSNSTIDVHKMIDDLYYEIDQAGIDVVYSSCITTMDRFMALPRKQELFAVINRMRIIDYHEDA